MRKVTCQNTPPYRIASAGSLVPEKFTDCKDFDEAKKSCHAVGTTTSFDNFLVL
jgi:hypothetical protein